MTTELEKLLGIDFSVCKNLLVGAGLTSLGMYRIYPAIRRGFCPSRMTSNN